MLYYRINCLVHTELLVRNSFQSQGFRLTVEIKKQRLAKI